MNTQSNTVPGLPVESTVADRRCSTRPFYWSVRREVWENRSIYIAPLIVAAFQVFGFEISTIGLADRRRAVLLLDPAHQRAAIEQPYDLAAMMMLFTVCMVGVYYCLDALHGEDRDRALAYADLWLVTPSLRLGASRDVSLGGVAIYRDSNL